MTPTEDLRRVLEEAPCRAHGNGCGPGVVHSVCALAALQAHFSRPEVLAAAGHAIEWCDTNDSMSAVEYEAAMARAGFAAVGLTPEDR